MDILVLLDRCAGLERMAAGLYEILAARFAADAELATLWSAMAADEREHARKLLAWRTIVADEPADRRPQASGFAAAVDAVERLLRRSRGSAPTADVEEAFALALGLESSELDAIYATLLQASPLSRSADLYDAHRSEPGDHHGRLIAAAERRCRTERNRLRIALLAAQSR